MDYEVIEKIKDYEVRLRNYKGDLYKVFISPNANYAFRFKDGLMFTWGKTQDDNPERFPTPNIADIEVTQCCTGLRGDGITCPFCYKSNTPTSGTYMTFEEFKHIIDVYPKSLTQVALGADACLTCNPDIWKMMEYCRSKNIVPNVTLANVVNDEIADNLAKYCGACAISCYSSGKVKKTIKLRKKKTP